MDRRTLLTGAMALGLAPTGAKAAEASDLRRAARDAFFYVLPLIEMGQARQRMLAGPGADQPAGINRFAHKRTLTDPSAHTITTPNNDTLYSSAWVDLTQGPVTLTVPKTGSRYLSVAVMDMYTDNVAVLGIRTLGGDGGRFTLVGPRQVGGGPDVVRLDTSHGWLLARTLVDGEADLPAAHAVQDQILLTGPVPKAPPATAPRTARGVEVFASAQALMDADPPRPEDRRFLRSIAALGLGTARGFRAQDFTPAQQAEIDAGAAEARTLLALGGSRLNYVKGWAYPRANLGFFGQDYLYRAGVALGGLAALTVQEAMYMRSEGEDGQGRFNGDGLYRFTMPARAPVDAFWSLTMYEATPQGQFFLTENPLRRYAVGDRTPGMKRNPDGSLDVWIGRSDPGGERSANWLPAPAKGPFSVTLRAYLPKPELMDGRFRFDPVVPA